MSLIKYPVETAPEHCEVCGRVDTHHPSCPLLRGEQMAVVEDD